MRRNLIPKQSLGHRLARGCGQSAAPAAAVDKLGPKGYVEEVIKRLRSGRRLWIWSLGILLAAFLHSQDNAPVRQSEPSKRQANDYMSLLLQRDTAQLGLKEDPALTRLLKQPSIDWAIRASARHILN